MGNFSFSSGSGVLLKLNGDGGLSQFDAFGSGKKLRKCDFFCVGVLTNENFVLYLFLKAERMKTKGG